MSHIHKNTAIDRLMHHVLISLAANDPLGDGLIF
ncbi:hypothetical protein MCECM63_01118 [Methylophilaceae bacterium]